MAEQDAELSPKATHKDLLARARAALDASDLDEAERCADALLGIYPDGWQGAMFKGEALAERGKFDEAWATIDVAIGALPNEAKLVGLARNLAHRHGQTERALGYARRIGSTHPVDAENNAFMASIALAKGDFEIALAMTEKLVTQSPEIASGWRYRAKALAAMRRAEEALSTLERAREMHRGDVKIKRMALRLAFHHGHFEPAIGLARELLAALPDDQSAHVWLVQSYMGLGDIEAARKHLVATRAAETQTPLSKFVCYDRRLKELQASAPALVDAWLAALRNRSGRPAVASSRTPPTVMIQYWSQGRPPSDVAFVVDQWRRVMNEEGLGELALFDRDGARAWMIEHAPRFLVPFDRAFHFAMESDIFRIAYASVRPCIYMDIDSWPLAHTAEILQYGIAQSESLLYMRSYRPYLVNGFFVSKPSCPFVRELVAQTLSLDLAVMPKDHITINNSFGPKRFNVIMLEMIARSRRREVTPGEAFGCSRLSLDDGTLHFAHEASVAAVRPPFTLAYKRTSDNWKGFSTEI